jgi:SAM-dependent methyltransferase
MKESWDSGNPYEQFMGRWSNIVARKFLKWLSPENGLRWLDVGCGSGALSESVIKGYSPECVTAIDQSKGFVQTAQKRLGSDVNCKLGDALNLPVEDNTIDVAVSGLVLNYISDAKSALTEMKRVTVNGGIVAIYVWDYAGKMEFLQTFWKVAELRNDVAALNEAKRFSQCNIKSLHTIFTDTGFDQIITNTIEISTRFADFDDYWNPFLGGQGPAPSYLKSLNQKEREHLRNLIYEQLPVRSDGSIPLSARALAIKGRVA